MNRPTETLLRQAVVVTVVVLIGATSKDNSATAGHAAAKSAAGAHQVFAARFP